MATFGESAIAMIGVIFIVLSASVLVPAMIMNLQETQVTSFEQTENERYSITGAVSSRAVNIRPSQNTANVTLLNGRTGDYVATGEMTVGETRSVTLDNETIEVSLVTITTETEAVFTYDYPLYIGWPSGAQTLVNNLTEVILLSLVVFLTGSVFLLLRVFSDV